MKRTLPFGVCLLTWYSRTYRGEERFTKCYSISMSCNSCCSNSPTADILLFIHLCICWPHLCSEQYLSPNCGILCNDTIGVLQTLLLLLIYSASCTVNRSRMSSSVILTSGTLSPLDSFATELGSDFPIRVEAPHVINVQKQCLVMGINSMGGIVLDGKYKNQQEEQYQVLLLNEHFCFFF